MASGSAAAVIRMCCSRTMHCGRTVVLTLDVVNRGRIDCDDVVVC